MKIVHLAGHLPDKINRGLVPLFYHLPRAEQKLGHRVWVFALSRNKKGWHRQHDLDVYYTPRPHLMRWRAGYRFLKTIKKEGLNPDIIHGFNVLPFGWLFPWGQRFVMSASFILSLHFQIKASRYHYLRNFKTRFQSWEFSQLSYYLARRVDLTLPVSAMIKKDLLAAGVPARKIKVIPTGIDLPRFPYRPKASLPYPPRLLYVGRFNPVKNVGWLLKALAPVEDYRLTLLGGSPDDEDWKPINNLIKQKPWRGKISITPPTNNERLASAYQQADVFVTASRAEGLNKTVLESMAVGTPVLTSDTDGIKEIVRDGETGYSFSLDHPEDFRAKLKDILTNTPKRRRIIAAARSQAEKYSLQKMAARYIAAYADVLKAGK